MITPSLRTAVRLTVAVAGVGLLASPASGSLVLYTSSSAFFSALGTAGLIPVTETFDSTAAGTTIPNGGSVGGITFNNFALSSGPDLLVDNSFATTSGANYLGVDNNANSNLIVGGDVFDMVFASGSAIGLNIITAETPNVSIFDNDVQLVVSGVGTALLDVDAVEQTLPGGDRVFFLGMIDSAATFTSAGIRYDPAAVGAIAFNIDDVTTAVIPEASELALFAVGALGLLVRRRPRRGR